MTGRTVTTASAPSAAETGYTEHLVSEVSKISSRELTERVIERARHAVLDWLGVSIAGAQEPSARAIQQLLTAEGGSPAAQVIGTPHRLTARQTALAGGIAAHALDYDDMSIGGHPSAVILPAVFALAEELDKDGPTTIQAMLFGHEARKMVAVACGNASYDRGYHGSSTFGAFGAAMGAGRLLELDTTRLRHALGIAGTQASGLRASFGTMSKHLNIGNAAAVGILSARLAEAGYTGDTTILEAPQGFAATHNNGPADFKPTGPGTSLRQRLAVEWLVFKPHALCGATHSAIEGFQFLRERHAFSADDVDEAEVFVSAQHLEVCDIVEPRTSVEGMFSIRYAAALALAGSATGPSALTEERIQDPTMAALRGRVRVTPVTRVRNITMPTEVRVRLRDGEELKARVNALAVKPDNELPRQWETLKAKFVGLVSPILGADRAREIIGLVRRIETLESIRELTDRTSTKR
ncbi:MmgE/PrpD family protein [Streptomyces sp. Inha503]|uniref:MmgE/PrpD family protein n=1 Tax=Streptomyces sp. Inha503 TaxID=3383314 RepID=UPI0039A08738